MTSISATANVTSLLLALMVGCGESAILMVRPPPDEVRATQTELWLTAVDDLVKDGDWLVIRGYHPTDDLVAAATNIPLSHVAIVDRTNDRIIEAVGEGVRSQPLRDFIHGSHRVLVIRPKWWTPKRGAAAAKRAAKWLGSHYDFLGAVGDDAPDRFYCSELAVHAYRKYFGDDERFPRVIEPGQMYLWGQILFDSGWRRDA